ncbi:HK97 gp10 family phage protein [Sphingobium sp. SYK-6]|uniref:HK97 gp10 family phage protein n=1 Tax=Sphingobium sp. (strain NBRC 103272 / SYK-6) TaxID=627192 RepID=UPI0011D1EA64|nr:HK97 gp10 family phage protein [Sphingobium sp. SYK-6]
MIGAKAHVARLRKLAGEATVRRVGKALFAAGELIQVESQIGITSGAVSGKNHTPGPVGGYPNADTHLLADSHETNQIAPLVVEISVNAPYAGYVHDGTSRMGARPYLQLARDAKKTEVTQLVRRAVDRAVKTSRGTE